MKALIALCRVNLFCLLALLVFSEETLAQQTITINGREFMKFDGKWHQLDSGKYYEVNPRVITVKFKSSIAPEAIAQFHSSQGVTVLRENEIGFVDLEIPISKDILDVLLAYLNSGIVVIAEANTFGEFIGAPNDQYFGNQWYLQQASDADIDATEAWDIETGKPSVIIAILDTGIDWQHEDLGLGSGANNYQNIWLNSGEDAWSNPNDPSTGNHIDNDNNGYIDDWKGWDFFNNNNDSRGSVFHGTAVAGVAAAKTNNSSIGVSGLAGGWGAAGAKLMAVGVGDDYTDGAVVDDAILYAASKGAKIINMSFGISQTSAIDAALQTASQTYGCVLVASSGNSASPVGYPARNTYVIAVGATTQTDLRATYSNYGPELDVVAPGDNIYTTMPGNSYGYNSYTSFSAPQVTGLAALLLSINPTLSNAQIETIIEQTTEDKGAAGFDNFYGNGRINAYQALLLTHIYSTKSVSSSATAFNGGRRVIKDGSNKYHAVFESGVTSGGNVLAEIFYRNHNGVSWSTPVRLSAGNEQNRYPSIAANGANLYAIWQRKNGSTHDVYFHKSTDGGASWASTNQQVRATSVGASDPLPVIASPATNELMLVYRSGNNLAWQRSTDNGGTWPTTGTISGTALNSPSLCAAKAPWGATISALAYATNVIPNASNIIARYFNSPSWSQEHNMSSGLPGSLSQHARPSIAPGGDGTTNLVHIAWDAYDSQYAARVIIHKAMSTWNVPSSYYEFHNIDEDQPSITGLASSKAAMVFRRGANSFFIGSYKGSSWSIQFPAVAGKYPSFSLGGTQAKHLITSGSAAPYQVTLSSSTYSKANLSAEAEKGSGYHRTVGLVDTTTGAWFNARVENFLVKHKDGSYSFVDFAPAPSDTLVLSTEDAWAALASGDFLLPVDAESLLVEVSVAGEKAASLSNSLNPLTLEFKAETANGQPRTRLSIKRVSVWPLT